MFLKNNAPGLNRMRALQWGSILFLYVLLPLMPLFLFLQAADPDITLFIRISRTAGIYGFVWYALQFVVTARNRIIERFVAQDRRLVLHMLTAVGVLLVVVVHTGFGNEKYASKLQAGLGGTADTIFLWATLFSGLFFSNYFIRFLPVLKPYRDKIAGFLRLTHERCLLLHYVMPVGMAVLISHIVFLPGQGLILFKTCMVMIGCSALSVFLYHKLIVSHKVRRCPWTVDAVIHESDSVVTVCLNPPPGRNFKHLAGQFCYIRPLDGHIPPESHPFTISSGPDEKQVCVSVKSSGDFTGRIKDITPGSRVSMDGPYGKFSYALVSPDRHLVFIAGGIGITPMLSMLRDLCMKDPKRKVILIWGARNETDLICLKEIQAIGKQMEQFVFEPVLSREPCWEGQKGRINRMLMTEIFNRNGVGMAPSDLMSFDFFICGPAQMTADMLQLLKQMKVSRDAIHTERFEF